MTQGCITRQLDSQRPSMTKPLSLPELGGPFAYRTARGGVEVAQFVRQPLLFA